MGTTVDARIKTKLLIDADLLAYRTAARHQKNYDWGDGVVSTVVSDIEDAVADMHAWLEGTKQELGADSYLICLSDDNANWRKAVLPTYKGHRKDTVRPELLYPLKGHLFTHYPSFRRPTLEADDVMGIIATTPSLFPGERKIICSIDKDLRQIPGMLYNGTALSTITTEEADWWHWMQMLTGDAVDGYKGCPGVGPVKAEKILGKACPAKGGNWGAVVEAYAEKGLTDVDALEQARVSRICRHENYDFKKKEVVLWSPE